jgi:curved DNA-binding protein CbpA
MQQFDPYLILGLTPAATPSAIKTAYRQRVQVTHPDRGGDREEFIVTVKAFGVLSDPDAKRLFDETGRIDDEAARSYRNEVVFILADMFDTAVKTAIDLGLPLDRLDFIDHMTKALKTSSTDAEALSMKLDGQIEALQALRSRIRRNGESPNIFADRISAQIAAKANDHAAARKRVALLDTAMVELGNYESEVELMSALGEEAIEVPGEMEAAGEAEAP